MSVDYTDRTFQVESKRPKTAQRQDDLNHRKIDYNVNLTSDSTAVLQAPKLRPPVNISYTVSIFRIPGVEKLFFLPPCDKRARLDPRNRRTRLTTRVATHLRSHDRSFGRVELCNLSHATECMRVCTNKTFVTSQVNNHVNTLAKHVNSMHTVDEALQRSV